MYEHKPLPRHLPPEGPQGLANVGQWDWISIPETGDIQFGS